MGGAVSAVEQGYMQREIRKTALQTQREIESVEQIIVGLNQFKIEQEAPADLLRIDPALATKQIDSLKKVKQNRDNEQVRIALQQLQQTASQNQNVMPAILQAVRVYATIGEICNTLRHVFGEYSV
jgi:methylmalonyl-CoA mutase N-terminal domain/subunit